MGLDQARFPVSSLKPYGLELENVEGEYSSGFWRIRIVTEETFVEECVAK
jgi:hypothetical protein